MTWCPRQTPKMGTGRALVPFHSCRAWTSCRQQPLSRGVLGPGEMIHALQAAARGQVEHLGHLERVVANDADIASELGKVAGQGMDERIVVVDHEVHGDLPGIYDPTAKKDCRGGALQRRPPAVFQMRLIWAHRGLVWTQFISDAGRVCQRGGNALFVSSAPSASSSPYRCTVFLLWIVKLLSRLTRQEKTRYPFSSSTYERRQRHVGTPPLRLSRHKHYYLS